MTDEFQSAIKTAPRTRKLPSDLLDERSTFMRHMSRGIPVPTIDDLMKHADRFGTDQVIETAVELGYGLDACVRLLDHCDRADVAAFKKLHPHGRASKVGSSEDRCKALMGITDDEEESQD